MAQSLNGYLISVFSTDDVEHRGKGKMNNGTESKETEITTKMEAELRDLNVSNSGKQDNLHPMILTHDRIDIQIYMFSRKYFKSTD